MTIAFTLKPEHYLQPHLAAIRHPFQVARAGAFSLFIFGTTLGAHLYLGPLPFSYSAVFIFACLFFALCFVCILLAPRFFVKNLRKGHYDLYLGQTILTLDDTIFSTEIPQHPEGKVESSYQIFKEITIYKDLISLVFDDGWGYLVPADSFESKEQLQEFLNILTEKTGHKFSPADRRKLSLP